MHLFTKLLLCLTITIFLGWQSVYAQVNMSNGSSTTCSTNFFDSGGSGSDYTSNQTLVYTFFPAIAGNKIQIDFTQFRSRNNASLEIFDGNTVGATSLDVISGNIGGFTNSYTSTAADGSLTFRFISGNNDRSGWESAISCVPPSVDMSTGSTTTCATGFFDSGGSGGNYSNGESFVHTFNPVLPTDKINVTFTSFDVENQATCNFDRLIIYDGPTTASPVLGTFCNASPGTQTASASNTSGSLTFEFISDGSVTEAGWEAEISCVSAPCPIVAGTAAISDVTACLGESITLSLTGQNSSSIQWQASTDGGTIFTDIVGATTDTEVVNPIVNTIYRAVVSNITCLPISSNSTTISVTMDNCSVIPPTGTTTLTTCNSTLFDSGGSAGNYTDNEDGTITIFPNIVGNFVRLTFTSFNTDAADILQVFDGNTIGATQIASLSGNITPAVLTSTAADGSLTLRFTSNGATNNVGFEIAISCFDPCPTVGGTATSSTPSVCSGENVTLNLTGQNGSSIQWQQSTDGGTTFNDIVGATTDTEIVNPTINITYRAVVSSVSCASSISSTVTVTITDCVIMPVGVSAVTTCGSTLFDSGGSVGDYTNNGDGTLTIFPSVAGSKVTITFTEFNTENGNDILQIFNGNSTAFPLLGNFSGTTIPAAITSTAIDGSLTLDFNANGSIVRPGWRADISCTCGWAFNNFTIDNCAGSNPTIYDLNIGFNAISPSPNYEVYVNGILQTTQAYGANPQTVTLVGLVNNNSPVEIELRDALDPTCNLTRTLFSAGTDQAICGIEADLSAQTSTGGQWTVVAGPNVPVFSNDLNPNASVTGLITGVYTLRWTSTVSGGCSFADEVTLTMDDNCMFDTSDPDVGNNCGGTFTSHNTYPANYPNNYNQVITLCPEAGQALQITFNTIDLGTGDDIQVWLSDTEAGAADLIFDDGDNGRSFTIKSQDVSGCITIRFTTDNNNTGDGFTSTISCTTPDDPASVDCIGAVPLCTDLTYAFPTGGGGAGTQNGAIDNGCAAYNNVKWFYLEIAATGDFEFDINPIVPSDDYDFAIWGPFASYGAIPCLAGDGAGMGAPIRCNYSGTTGTTGVTGLNTAGNNDSEPAAGPVYSNELPVVIGEFYMMMVDDFGNQGNGFNITASPILGDNPTNCEIVDCDAFFGNQVFSSTGSTNFGSNYICYSDAVTIGAVDNSYTLGGVTGEELYFVHSDNPNTLFNLRNNFTLDNLFTSDYVTTNLGGIDNNQLTFTNDGTFFADNQIWNIYATTGVAGAPDPTFVNSCSFWFPFEVKLLPEITATLPVVCGGTFSITDIEGGLPRFQEDREGGANTNYTVNLLDAGNAVAYTQSVALGNDANFTAVATGTYTVQIIDQNGCPVSIGTVSISNPTYDNFCNAEPVFLGSNGTFTNECATSEIGETGGSCFTGVTDQVDQSIWTAFTAPTTTDYLFRITHGTDATFPATGGLFDSEIAIYSNSAICPAPPVLTELACNDDNAAIPSVYSEIPTIALTAGVTYYVQIDGKAFFPGGVYGGSSNSDGIILYIEEFDLLPIELKLFDGTVKDEGNLIFWETAMEKDVEYFSLEASTDGLTFFEVNRQSPNQEPSNYEFLHTEPQQKMYYRLKDVSQNGDESYSNVIYLVRENVISIEKGLLGIYPNPTLDNITIRMFYPNLEEVSLQLYDTKGVELINTMIEIPSSQVIEKTLSLTNLPAGVYILSLTTKTGKEVVKVVKQ